MKYCISLVLACVLCVGCSFFKGSGDICAVSPDGRNVIRLNLKPLSYEVLRDGKIVVSRSSIALRISGKRLSRDVEEITPVISTGRVMGKFTSKTYKKSKIFESGYETNVDFGKWGIRLIARDDGVAYRFETRFPDKIRVNGERAGFSVPNPVDSCWVHFTDKFGCEETRAQTLKAQNIKTDSVTHSHSAHQLIYLPFVYRTGETTVAVMDADVYDYPVRYFDEGESIYGGVPFKSVFPGWPKRKHHSAGGTNVLDRGGRWIKVDKYADWLVETEGTRVFPWRVFALADAPCELFENDIVYALSRPANPEHDFSWVKPGKVAWEWWNAFNNKGQFKGCTTEGYRRFIDFAAKNGIEYVILDEGWSKNLDIWRFNEKVDVPEIINYANAKGVGIILWLAWAQAYGDEERVVSHFAELGAKGFKVDFIDRADADAQRFLWKFAEVCRKYKMIVDYHGVPRPGGLNRAYPNVLNYEAVHGLEQMKWNSGDVGFLENDVKICFTRMSAGPMDYTPGAMDNYAIGKYPSKDKRLPDGLRYTFVNPGSVGTRSRQMAMMVLYDAPLQMLCDAPDKYEKNKECLNFISSVPTVWDETVGLGGSPDSHAVVARRKADVWYVAGITNGDQRYFTIDTSFMHDETWKVEIFKDNPSIDNNPTSYVHSRLTTRSGDRIVVRMAPGGGFVARFSK